MKSIKPGRGPSRRAAVMSVFMAIFGVIWTIIAISIGSNMGFVGMIFPIFGVIFIIIAIYNAIYHSKNANNKNRYSLFDIPEHTEEPDPLDEQISALKEENADSKKRFCPYCGKKTDGGKFCSNCGNKL